MTTVRTIGYHENAPNTSSIGSRKRNVVSPPPLTQVRGERRARCQTTGFASSVFTRAGSRALSCASMGSARDMRGSTVLRVVQGLGADPRRPARQLSLLSGALADEGLCGAVRRVEELLDVG